MIATSVVTAAVTHSAIAGATNRPAMASSHGDANPMYVST